MIAELYGGPRDGEVHQVEMDPLSTRPKPQRELIFRPRSSRIVPRTHPAAIAVSTVMYVLVDDGDMYPTWKINAAGRAVYQVAPQDVMP